MIPTDAGEIWGNVKLLRFNGQLWVEIGYYWGLFSDNAIMVELDLIWLRFDKKKFDLKRQSCWKLWWQQEDHRLVSDLMGLAGVYSYVNMGLLVNHYHEIIKRNMI